MFRKTLIIILVCALLGLGTVLLWPKATIITPIPTPTNPVFPPSFVPTSSVSASPTTATQPISVSIISTPQGAKITVNNQSIGTTPIRYSFQSQTQYHIVVEKDGFVTQSLDFTPTDSTLRLQLVALNTLPTNTVVPSSSPTATPTLPTAVPVDFPQTYSLNHHTLPTQQFTYTAAPSTNTTISAQPTTTTNTPIPQQSPVVQTSQPTESEISLYEDVINRYTGVYASDANDEVEQGTAGEHVIVISDKYFYPSPVEVFVAFKPHFVNITTSTCTLRALTDQNTTIPVGSLAPNQDLIFTPSPDLNGTWQFWCQEKPSVVATIQFFS